jgi:hypothetical protein
VLRQQWAENLKTGLKDSNGNVVGIPIDQAIEKVVMENRIPQRADFKLEIYAIDMPTAASSGRETEKKLQ